MNLLYAETQGGPFTSDKVQSPFFALHSSLAIWVAFDDEEVHFLLVLPAASSDSSTWSWETLIRSQGAYEAFPDWWMVRKHMNTTVK